MTDKEIKRLMAEKIRSLGGEADENGTFRDIAKAARQAGLESARSGFERLAFHADLGGGAGCCSRAAKTQGVEARATSAAG